MIIEFPTLPAALAFLQRESPVSADEAWAQLGRFTLLRKGNGAAVALECAPGVLDDGAFGRAVRCGGKQQDDHAPAEIWKERVPMQGLFRRVRLEASNRTERGKHFLVVPQGLDAGALSSLIEWLSQVEGCSVWVRDVRKAEVEGTLTVFELRTESDTPIATPAGLPGAPQILAGVDDDVFVPAGLGCPLLPAHRFLFPPLGDGRLHAWLVGPKGTPSHVELSSVGEAVPLARVVVLPADAVRAPVATGTATRVSLPLRLRPINAKRRLRRASQVLYVVESRGAELGAALLRLFDHAEAGIEQFTYFSRAMSDGPNAVVEHFLLAEARIADDDMWPELRRFDLPRSLAEVGLRLFLPADADFSPDLEGVVLGLDADDEFLRSLRSTVGLTDAPSDRMALVEPSPKGGLWRITTLEKGRPLQSLISVVIEAWNREPIRRLVDTQRVDLSADRRKYEDQWLAVGSQEATEVADTTRALATSLGESVAQVVRQLSGLAERVGALRETSSTAQELVTAAPAQFAAFIEGVAVLVESVASPRREWLQAAEARRQAMESLAAAVRELQRNVHGEVDRAGTGVMNASREFAGASERLTQAREALERAMTELEPQVASAMSAAHEAAVAIQARRVRVQTAENDVTARERALREQSAEVDRLQEAVRARELAVAQQQRALEARRVALEARLDVARRAETEAKADEQRLRHIEAVDLPSAQRRCQEAEEDLARWQAKRLDERLREVQSESTAVERECARLRDDEERLTRLRTELSRLNAESVRLRETVASLRAQGLEVTVQTTSAEAARLSTDVGPLEVVAGSIRSARQSLGAAESALAAVQSARGMEDLARRIDELDARARQIESDCRRAASRQLPTELEARLSEIERMVREARRASGQGGRRWLGRWFGGRP